MRFIGLNQLIPDMYFIIHVLGLYIIYNNINIP